MSEDRTVESHDLPPFTARQQSTQGSHSGYRDNDRMTSYRTRQADFTVKAAAEEGHVIRPPVGDWSSVRGCTNISGSLTFSACVCAASSAARRGRCISLYLTD